MRRPDCYLDSFSSYALNLCRLIKGATDWSKYEVVLDVQEATGIFFGGPPERFWYGLAQQCQRSRL
jgi:hypothetical protein